MGGLVTVFFTGLLTGGLSCLAVQGGLLATCLVHQPDKKTVQPTISFLVSKLIAYTLLGLLLGWFGSLFQLSLTARLIMQIAVAVFMVGNALALLDVHPFFRRFVLTPPKFLTRLVKNQTRGTSILTPAFLGAFTVFVPCGTTQAMMALSIASGSPLMGAAIMFAFVLGTSPVFFTLGVLASRLSHAWHRKFLKFAAAALILLAVFNINNALALGGSPWTLNTLAGRIRCAISVCPGEDPTPAVTEATITFLGTSYSPRVLSVPRSSKIRLNLVNEEGRGCIQAFTIPQLNLEAVVSPGTSKTIEFTSPDQPGNISFMCSMGMYRGVIKVI